jgi:uncharacterized membrane protein YbjE (DUF340 family)
MSNEQNIRGRYIVKRFLLALVCEAVVVAIGWVPAQRAGVLAPLIAVAIGGAISLGITLPLIAKFMGGRPPSNRQA